MVRMKSTDCKNHADLHQDHSGRVPLPRCQAHKQLILTKDNVWQHSAEFLRVSIIVIRCFSCLKELLNGGLSSSLG